MDRRRNAGVGRHGRVGAERGCDEAADVWRCIGVDWTRGTWTWMGAEVGNVVFHAAPLSVAGDTAGLFTGRALINNKSQRCQRWLLGIMGSLPEALEAGRPLCSQGQS